MPGAKTGFVQLGLISPTATGAVPPRLQACHKEEVDDLVGAVGKANYDRSTCGRLGQELRMMDRDLSAVRQMNVERLKRTGGM